MTLILLPNNTDFKKYNKINFFFAIELYLVSHIQLKEIRADRKEIF